MPNEKAISYKGGIMRFLVILMLMVSATMAIGGALPIEVRNDSSTIKVYDQTIHAPVIQQLSLGLTTWYVDHGTWFCFGNRKGLDSLYKKHYKIYLPGNFRHALLQKLKTIFYIKIQGNEAMATPIVLNESPLQPESGWLKATYLDKPNPTYWLDENQKPVFWKTK